MKILRVNIAEAEPAELARRLRQVADKIESGARGGNTTDPHVRPDEKVGSFGFIEINDKGKEVPSS